MRWVQYTYCYIFFSLGLPLCEFQERESPIIQHSFETLLERPSWFLYVSHPGSVMLSIKCPQESLSLYSVLLQDTFTWLLWFIMSCFCSPSPPKSSHCDCGKRVQFYYPNTKADLKPKEIVAHSHIAPSASLTSEMRHFISNHGLKTI